MIAGHGLPCALYTDRASHDFVTPKAGEKVAKDQLTQVGRALAQLGNGLPSGRQSRTRGSTFRPRRPKPGGSERAFGTLQDRLPKEFQLAGITTVAAANRFLRETYLPEHNARFAVAPEPPETAFVADRAGAHRDIRCVQLRALPRSLPADPAEPAAAACHEGWIGGAITWRR